MTHTICKKVCKECPWRREAVPGWLGEASYDPWGFSHQHIHGILPLACHKQVDWSDPDAKFKALVAPLCRGFAIYMRNCMSMPRNLEVALLVQTVEPDHEKVFSTYREFHVHHARKDTPLPRHLQQGETKNV